MITLATLAVVPRQVREGEVYLAAEEKTTLACIGMGGHGHVSLLNLLQLNEVQVARVCGVNREGGGYISWNWMQRTEQMLGGREPARRLVVKHYAQQKVVPQYQGCRTYADYRELLDREDVDAAVIGTPDHTHAAVTMAALQKQKHVYCEKPLAYSVLKVRQITEAARRAGLATQLGNHGQVSEKVRLPQEIIIDGAIGPVREVHVNLGPRFWDPPAWGHPAGFRSPREEPEAMRKSHLRLGSEKMYMIPSILSWDEDGICCLQLDLLWATGLRRGENR